MQTTVVAIDRGLQHIAANRQPAELSPAVNLALDEHQDMLAMSLPDFYPEEWALIFDALNGNNLVDPFEIKHLWLSVSDACHEDRLGEKWDVDAERLTARLEALTYPELVAVAELKRRYVRMDKQSGQPNDAIISRLIADIQVIDL